MFRTLAKTQELETRCSGGASQLVGLPTVLLNLGSFNCGIDHRRNLGRVIAKGVMEQDLHLLNLCEVGGHKKGLDESKKRAQNIVSEVLHRHYKAISCQAYMATWHSEAEPTDATSVTLTLVGQPEVVEISASVQPQLVIMVFTIASAENRDKHGLLISGLLHIRTSTGEIISKATRKRIVKAALQAMEHKASTVSSGVSQPAAPVFVLTGDVNLNKTESDTIVQKMSGDPSLGSQWQVLTSNAARSGDLFSSKALSASHSTCRWEKAMTTSASARTSMTSSG